MGRGIRGVSTLFTEKRGENGEKCTQKIQKLAFFGKKNKKSLAD